MNLNASGANAHWGFGLFVRGPTERAAISKLKINNIFTLLELEWSSWSQCTATCGKHGIQMRFLRCEDKFLNRGCRHLKEPQKETRACHLPPCHKKINRWIPVQ